MKPGREYILRLNKCIYAPTKFPAKLCCRTGGIWSHSRSSSFQFFCFINKIEHHSSIRRIAYLSGFFLTKDGNDWKEVYYVGPMVFISYDCLIHYAHIWSKPDISICWRHLVTFVNSFLIRPIMSYVRNMFWAAILYKYPEMWLPGDWKDKPGIQGFVVIFQARFLQQTQTTLARVGALHKLGGLFTGWKRC